MTMSVELKVIYVLTDDPQKIIVGDMAEGMSDLRGKKFSLLLSFLFGTIIYIAN